MNRRLSFQLLCLSILMSTAIAQGQTRAGGEAGGGGNLCYLQGRPVLLDFVPVKMRPPSSPGIRYPQDDPRCQLSYSTPNDCRAFDFFGFGLMFLNEIPRFRDRVYAVLERNRRLSPKLVRLLSGNYIGLFATPFSTQTHFRADLSDAPECTPQNVRAVAVYANQNTAFVDVNQWNELDLDTQIGIYFHENARVLQNLLVRLGSPIHLRDSDLQRMVRNLMYHAHPMDDLPWVEALSREMPVALWPITPNETPASCRLRRQFLDISRARSGFQGLPVATLVEEVCFLYHRPTKTPAQVVDFMRAARDRFTEIASRSGDQWAADVREELNSLLRTYTPARFREIQEMPGGLDPARAMNWLFLSEWPRDRTDHLIQIAFDYSEAEAAHARDPSPGHRRAFEQAARRRCHVIENIRDFMTHGDPNRVRSPAHISAPNSRCL